jgi:hypothetical protein
MNAGKHAQYGDLIRRIARALFLRRAASAGTAKAPTDVTGMRHAVDLAPSLCRRTPTSAYVLHIKHLTLLLPRQRLRLSANTNNPGFSLAGKTGA